MWFNIKFKAIKSYSSLLACCKRNFKLSGMVSNFSEKFNDLFPEQCVRIQTCGRLYDKWRVEKKFPTIPGGPLSFEVKYVDNQKHLSPTSSVVLALHGAPGSYMDYSNLMSHLNEKEVRVVIPSFPDFKAYRPGVFRHSAEEKAEYLTDFLHAASIKEIDTLVVHSSAVYPGLLLCLKQNPVVKSIVMLNPGTFSKNMKTTKHFKFMQMCVKMGEVSSVLKTVEWIGPSIFKVIKLPVRTTNVLDPLLSATCMVNATIPESKERFVQLAKSGFPMLYAFSDDDRLIGKECSYELAHLLGATESDVFKYDKEGNLVHRGKDLGHLKVMSFENGSHYVFWRHSEIVLETISEFILQLKSRDLQNVQYCISSL